MKILFNDWVHNIPTTRYKAIDLSRYWSIPNPARVVLAEMPPHRRTLLIGRWTGNRYLTEKLNVQLPHMQFILTTRQVSGQFLYQGLSGRGLQVYFTDGTVQSNRPLCVSTLENQRNGVACTPHEYDGAIYKTEIEMLESVVSIWYNSLHIPNGIDLSHWRVGNFSAGQELSLSMALAGEDGRKFSLLNSH